MAEWFMVTLSMPNTKIVATLGPASSSPEMIRRMLTAGVDVVRLNASHGTQEERGARIAAVRSVARELDRHVGILLDLQGPKIRLGKLEGDGCELKTGQFFTITVEPILGNCEHASTTYANFANDVEPGSRVLLNDGAVELRAIKSDGVSVRFEVVSGGPIGNNKGINLPGVRISAPSLTEKDIRDLRFGLEHGVDLLALSFVRTADDVRALRKQIEGGPQLPIIAKIEKPQAWENMDSILAESSGVMVARGDLGVEMALEKVPFIQKSIIHRARRYGKSVITATQMLESMVENPMPTRAEVSDVFNAIYDGTDAVMLSAETSIGKHPVEAVSYMARIASEAERSLRAHGFQEPPHNASPTYAEILADAAYHAARDASVAAIVVFTASGSSARLISRLRPLDRIYAITPSDIVARQLTLNYGVTSVLAPDVDSTDEMVRLSDRLLVERGYLKQGESVAFVAGQPIGRPGTTNLMKLHRVGDA